MENYKPNIPEKQACTPEEPEAKKSEKTMEQELSELKDLLLHTQANFENYRKQVEKRVEEMKQMAGRDIILQLLPIIDNWDLALKNVDNTPEFATGMKLIRAQMQELLVNNDLKPIISVGNVFDPYYHEALMKVESNLPENIILEEFQSGFTLNGVVLRHAKVKISAGKKTH